MLRDWKRRLSCSFQMACRGSYSLAGPQRSEVWWCCGRRGREMLAGATCSVGDATSKTACW